MANQDKQKLILASDLVINTYEYLKKYFVKLFFVAGIMILPKLLVEISILFLPKNFISAAAPLIYSLYFLTIVIFIWSSIVFVNLIVYNKYKQSYAALYREAFKKIAAYVWTIIFSFFLIWLTAQFAFIIIIATTKYLVGILAFIGYLLGALAAVGALVVLFYSKYGLIIAALEGFSAQKAFEKSFDLIRGYFWPVILKELVLFLVLFLIGVPFIILLNIEYVNWVAIIIFPIFLSTYAIIYQLAIYSNLNNIKH